MRARGQVWRDTAVIHTGWAVVCRGDPRVSGEGEDQAH